MAFECSASFVRDEPEPARKVRSGELAKRERGLGVERSRFGDGIAGDVRDFPAVRPDERDGVATGESARDGERVRGGVESGSEHDERATPARAVRPVPFA